jgi:hypothetical protein
MPLNQHGGIDFTATYTFAAASAAGYANDVAYSGGGYALTATTAGDGCAHPVTILGNAATNHSAKTFTITGTDANGVAITNAIAGPNGVATVTSTKRFKTVTSVTVDSTTNADTFDIGWTALASTPWVLLNSRANPFEVGIAGTLVSGSANFDLEHTYDDITTNATTQVAYNNATFAGKTASFDVGLTYPVRAVRLDVNSHTSGVLRFHVLQPVRD